MTNPIKDAVWAGAISAPLAAEIDGSQVCLKGTFGVFVPGRLIAQLVTTKGEIIAGVRSRSVDPREVVEVNKTVALPADA